MAHDFEQRLESALQRRPPRPADEGRDRPAAVLIPIVAEPEPALIFTVRTDAVPTHKGQISFPGGSVEQGEAPRAAALREAREEIGLDEGLVRILGELDQTPTFVSGFVITPVVGWLEERPQLKPNAAEVASILIVPIARLTEEIRAEPGFVHSGRSYPTEAWVYEGHVIWGLTARLLRLLLEMLADAGLAAAPGPTSLPWAEPRR